MVTSQKQSNTRRNTLIGAAVGVLACCCVMACLVLVLYLANMGGNGEARKWSLIESGTHYNFHSVTCPSPSICYAPASLNNDNSTLFKSTDSGLTWVAAPSPKDNAYIQWVFCTAETDCFVSFDDRPLPNLYATVDGAQNWVQTVDSTNLEINLAAADCINSTTTCYALVSFRGYQGVEILGTWAGQAIFETTDAGASWQPLTLLSEENAKPLTSLACPSASLCVAAGGRRSPMIVLIPTNGDKESLVQLDPDILATEAGLNAIACPSPSICYVVGSYDRVQENNPAVIFKSSDAGTSWTMQASGAGTQFHDISCATENMCVAVGSSPSGNFVSSSLNTMVVVTTDGGATWHIDVDSGTNKWDSILTGQRILTGVSCASEISCIVVGNDGVILRYEGVTPSE